MIRLADRHARGPLGAFLAGSGFLVAGLVVYVAARAHPPPAVAHISSMAGLDGLRMSALWLPAAGWLPTALHVIAFSLITHSILADRGRHAGACVGIWTGINILFELAQAPQARLVWERTNLEFGLGLGWRWPVGGVFCYNDLAAAVAGGAVAYLLIKRLGAAHEHDERQRRERFGDEWQRKACRFYEKSRPGDGGPGRDRNPDGHQHAQGKYHGI